MHDTKKLISVLQLENTINVYKINANKFKTDAISIFFMCDLNRDTASKNTLFPSILKRGSVNFPTFRSISTYLEQLYGANLDYGVIKKGETHVLQFYIEYAKSKYIDDKQMFKNTFELLTEIITNPLTEHGVFKEEYFIQEKQNIKDLIESQLNNKSFYALERCCEEMCKDEPFGIYTYGDVKTLQSIENKDLYQYYLNLLRTSPMHIYITDEIDDSIIESTISNAFSKFGRSTVKYIRPCCISSKVTEVKDIVEAMDISQSKLSLGFRTRISGCSKDYYKLLVFNGILGDGVTSKLFRHVREEQGLAYYIFSRIDRFKDIMLISSGIDAKNKDKAISTILNQLDEIKNGNISDYEYNTAIKNLENNILSIHDSHFRMIDFYFNQFLLNINGDVDDIIQEIKSVSKRDVVEIAKNIELDTKYFLTSNDNNSRSDH